MEKKKRKKKMMMMMILFHAFLYIYAYSFLDVEVFDQVVLVWSSQIPQEGTLNLEE